MKIYQNAHSHIKTPGRTNSQIGASSSSASMHLVAFGKLPSAAGRLFQAVIWPNGRLSLHMHIAIFTLILNLLHMKGASTLKQP